MKKNIIIFLDRDGTINKDEDYYLGSSKNWKKQIEFLPGVIEGLKLLNKISNSYIFILTNQSGVALKDFPNLTEKRMCEVNDYIINILSKSGIKIKGYYACPFVDNDYVKKAESKGKKIIRKYIKNNHQDIKPNIGMVEKAISSLNLKKEECKLFVIGDRFSDMLLAENSNAEGILIQSYKTHQLSDENFKSKNYKEAKNFLEASLYIKNFI